MRPKVESERLAVLIENTPGARFHLIVGRNEIGMVFFACAFVPLVTLQTFESHKLERCPFCGTANPLEGETHDNQQG
jgi:hypothetical protein